MRVAPVPGRVEAGEPLGPLVRGKEDEDEDGKGRGIGVGNGELSIGWTVVYYVLLVVGAMGFAWALWPLTQSYNALVDFGVKSGKDGK